MWKKRILHAFFNRRALPQTASEINQKINDNELFAPFGRMHQLNLQPLLVRKILYQKRVNYTLFRRVSFLKVDYQRLNSFSTKQIETVLTYN